MTCNKVILHLFDLRSASLFNDDNLKPIAFPEYSP